MCTLTEKLSKLDGNYNCKVKFEGWIELTGTIASFGRNKVLDSVDLSKTTIKLDRKNNTVFVTVKQ